MIGIIKYWYYLIEVLKIVKNYLRNHHTVNIFIYLYYKIDYFALE